MSEGQPKPKLEDVPYFTAVFDDKDPKQAKIMTMTFNLEAFDANPNGELIALGLMDRMKKQIDTILILRRQMRDNKNNLILSPGALRVH